MKILFVVAVLFSTLFSSCVKKEYTCTCVTTVNGFIDETKVTIYSNVTKSTAKSKCLSSTSTSGPAYTKVRECDLK